MKTFGLAYETEQLTPIIMEEFGYSLSIAKLIARRLYELARDICNLKKDANKSRLDGEKFDRLEKLVNESNLLAEELGAVIIHSPPDAGYGFILVLPSGKSNNPKSPGWEVYRWRQYFIDEKKTIDMNGLSW